MNKKKKDKNVVIGKESYRLLKRYREVILKYLQNENLCGSQIAWMLEKEFKVDFPVEMVEQYIWELEDHYYKNKRKKQK